jgi:hypothetical protein
MWRVRLTTSSLTSSELGGFPDFRFLVAIVIFAAVMPGQSIDSGYWRLATNSSMLLRSAATRGSEEPFSQKYHSSGVVSVFPLYVMSGCYAVRNAR